MVDINKLPVAVNEASIDTLTKFYKKAYRDVVDEMVKSEGFGVFYRRRVLKDIRGILTEFGVNVNDFIENEIEGYYKGGAQTAVKQLKQYGAKPAVRSGFQRAHKQAIREMINETQVAFKTSLNGVYRSASQIISKATRDYLTLRLAEGTVTGKSLRQLKSLMIQDLRQNGLASLIDKGGRKWSLDTYTEMLIRTKAVEARNRGMANRMAENDEDLVVVSTHGSEHQACAIWEGEILSITGNTPGYATLGEAQSTGLFHPNCKHAINVFVPGLSDSN